MAWNHILLILDDPGVYKVLYSKADKFAVIYGCREFDNVRNPSPFPLVCSLPFSPITSSF